ncbi:MAG TPA: PAS domain-containing protein [Steroidobacter sp.]|nr:PAS domain-containing protein [Steroidobacteraceae bacterium]HLS82678.1 PAS domain-containing protein [Steroidobacter sp.]
MNALRHIPAASGEGRAAEEGVDAAARSDIVRQVFDALSQSALVLDRNLRVLVANRAVGKPTPRQIEGLPMVEVFPPELHGVALTTMHRVLASAQVDGFCAQIQGAGAEPRHFDVRVAPVLQQSRVAALTVIASETTEQVRAERAIATQARMIESMLEGVAVIDESGRVEVANPAFDDLFGYRRGELIGREMSSLAGWPFEQPERWRRAPGTRDASMRVEFEGRRADGTHFAAAGLLSRFEVAGRSHSLLVLQDVSERKHLERAILEAVNHEQYRIGNDLHDGLGQELTGIALMLRGVAGRLNAEYPAILPEVESIMRLVNNAIESTRALARGLSPVNLERGGLRDALEGLAMHASELYGAHVTFTHRLSAPQAITGELANHLYRIAQEAVRNAVRHGQARSIRLHLHGARAKVRLIVTDDGKGLPEDAMDAPGMGLKIMSYRARMLGGEVRFERAEPQGLRIVCECPIEASRTPRSADRMRSKRKSSLEE